MRMIIDTDPGVDDGVALTMALCSPGVTVEAITVVKGNAGLAQTVSNARLVVETCGAGVPVYAGAHAPLVRPAVDRPSWIHGADGFGDLGLLPRRADADLGFAPDRIVELIMAAPGEITLVTIGPLTNIALALAREPRIARAARALVMMGGAQAMDNATPAAEFNVQADPEAAGAVFAAGFALTTVGAEICRGPARLTEDDVAAIRALDTPPARLVGALLGHSLAIAPRRPMLPGERGAACSDAVAMAVALDPAVVSASAEAFVDVETAGRLTTDTTVAGRPGDLRKPPNARVALAIDAVRFKRLLLDRCR